MAGGLGGGNRHSSTEVLASTSSAWVLANNLPRKMSGMSSVTLGNIIYLTGEYNIVGWGTDNILVSGGYDGDNERDRDEVLQWTGEDWVEVAKMKKARNRHAASTIVMNKNIMKFCK